MAASRPKPPADRRIEPKGPFGHLLRDAMEPRNGRGRLSYADAVERIHRIAKLRDGKATSYSTATIRNWIGRWVIPTHLTLGWIAEALEIPLQDVIDAADAAENERYSSKLQHQVEDLATIDEHETRKSDQNIATATAAAQLEVAPPVQLADGHSLLLPPPPTLEVRSQTDRRAFIIGTGTTVGTLLLADRAERADVLERLRCALARPNLDTSTLAYLETRFAGYWHDYHVTRLPASELLSYALDDLNKINCLLEKSALTTTRAQLHNLTAHAAIVVGALLWDTGAHTQSRNALQMSLMAAREAGNAEIEAIAHAWLAFGWMYDSSERDTWQTALQSIRAGRELCQGTGTLASWLAAIEAEIQAHLGDRSGCLASLREAGHSTDLTVANPQWYWTRFDDAALAGYRGIVQLRLGAASEARAALSDALRLLDSSEGQRRLTLLIDLARASAQDHAIDEACAHTRDAMRMAADYQSPVKTQRLLPLRQQLARHHDTPAVRQLEEELMAPDISDKSQ